MTIRRPLTLINGLLRLLPTGDWLPGNDIGARVFRTSSQSIPSGTQTAIAFTGARYNASGIWTAGAPTRFTCNTAGKYLIGGCLSTDPNGSGVRQIGIFLNGTTYIALHQGDNNMIHCAVSCVYNLAVNDYLQLITYQDSGVALNVIPYTAHSPEFYMHLLA